MREKPWQAINLLTGETVGWYERSEHAWIAHLHEPIEVIYRPGRKRKVKKDA